MLSFPIHYTHGMSSGLVEAFKHLAVNFYSFYCILPAHLLFSLYSKPNALWLLFFLLALSYRKELFIFAHFVCSLWPCLFSLYCSMLSVLLMLQLVLLTLLDTKSCLQGRMYFFPSSLYLFFLLYCIGWDFWTYETVIATKEIFSGSPRTWPDVAPGSPETPFVYSWTDLWCCLWAKPCTVYLRSQRSYVEYLQSSISWSFVFLCLIAFLGLSHREPLVLHSSSWRDEAQHSSHPHQSLNT